MRNTACVLAGILAAGLPGAAEEPQAELRGVPVQAVWQTANGLNASWLLPQPQFAPSGRTFVARWTLDAKKPETGQPIGLEIVWTVAEVADAPAGLSSFALPADTTMVVVGRYAYAPTGRTVETYAAVQQKADGSLVSEDLGVRLPDGSVAPSTGNLASQAFHALGIRGPYTTIITLPPGDGD